MIKVLIPISLVFYILVVFGANGQLESKEVTFDISGNYCGALISNGVEVPVFTSFQAMDDSVAGSYGFFDLGQSGAVERGALVDCTLSHGMLSCRWLDSYGTGAFEAFFSDGSRNFVGFWTSDFGNASSRHVWTGARASRESDCLAQPL